MTFTGVPAGGWFGEGSLLKNELRKYDVMALRDTRVARMPRATFEWLLETSLPFNRFLLMQLNERLGQFIGLVENDRTLDIDTRVARCLAAMFNSHLYPGLETTGPDFAGGNRLPVGRLAPARQPGPAAAGKGRACCGSIMAASACSTSKACASFRPE